MELHLKSGGVVGAGVGVERISFNEKQQRVNIERKPETAMINHFGIVNKQQFSVVSTY